MKIYEQRIIGGIINGILKPSEIGLTNSDFENEVLSQIFMIALKLEIDKQEISMELIYEVYAEKEFLGWLNLSDLQNYSESVTSIISFNYALDKIKSGLLNKNIRRDIEQILESESLSGGQILNILKEKRILISLGNTQF